MAKKETVFLEIQLPEKKVIGVKQVIEALKAEEKLYLEAHDLSDVAFYERMKRRIVSYLSSLDNYKTTFVLEAERLEDYVKKTIRNQIIEDLVESKKASSYTAAEKLVELDDKYKSYKSQYWEFKTIADSVSGKYWVYSKLFDGVVQSVSVATKERQNTKLAE